MARVKLSLEQFRDRMGRMPDRLSKAIIGGMRAGLLLSLKSAKNEYILGTGGLINKERLTSRSGRLRRSIRVIEPKAMSGMFVGGLRAGGSGVPYAAIHERGGVTRPHVIIPRRKKALSWLPVGHRHGFADRYSKSGRIFARKVNHPGSRIPARPYLYPALEKNLPQISKQISVAVDVAFAKGLGA